MISVNEIDVTSSWSSTRKCTSVAVLVLINALNYMDRFTIAGVLTQIQVYFDIDDSSAGLLQTAFIVFYMLFAPLCGYLGDRYNRKIIMETGIIIWVFAILLSSFCGPAHFILFILFRGVVGIGEASFVTVAPTIIADMYVGNKRSTALMVFYIALPIGSGLGYIVSAAVAQWTGAWQWGVRLTPLIGLISILLLIFVLEEPTRGEAQYADSQWSFLADIKYILTVPTYVITTFALTAIVFVMGSLAWWAPTLMQHAWAVQHGTSQVSDEVKAQIGLTFGIITCFGGLLGVLCGSELAQIWRSGFCFIPKNIHADPHVCALGSLMAIPFLYFALILPTNYSVLCWISIFLCVIFCCFSCAINMDILMYVVTLRRCSIALALQTLISHLFGDACSPYFIGALSDALRGDKKSTFMRFIALQRSLFVPNFILCFSGFMYLLATFYIDRDRRNAQELAHRDQITIGSNSVASLLTDADEQSSTS